MIGSHDRKLGRASARAASVATAILLSCVPAAGGHYGLGHYTRSIDNSACAYDGRDDLLDPINVSVFAGATPMARQAEKSVGIKDDHGASAGADQRLADHGSCDQQAEQRAENEGGVPARKFHVRIWGNHDRDRKGRPISAGDAHYERKVLCGANPQADSVYESYDGRSGFDHAAKLWIERLPNHYYGYFKRPRRQTAVQCNGDQPGWNGRQFVFRYDGS
jgi:hypothetical protein